jgi:hypothetical protein
LSENKSKPSVIYGLKLIIPDTTYRIVETDNLGRDYPDEKFIVYGIKSKKMADAICETLNSKFTNPWRYHKVVDNNYQLAPEFEP